VKKAFERLGADIERRWAAIGGGFDSFPRAAVDKLSSFVTDEIATGTLLADLCRNPFLPPQLEPLRPTSNPCIQVWRGKQFHIEVLFVVEPATAIHDHPFAGAFGVVDGSSLEIEYTWEETEPIAHAVDGGTLTMSQHRLFGPGDVCALAPELSHSMAHLGLPSVLVVARTTATRPRTHMFLPGGTRITENEVKADEDTLGCKLLLANVAARLEGEPAASALSGLSDWGARDPAAAFELARAAADVGQADWITEHLQPTLQGEHSIDASYLADAVEQRQLEHRLCRALHKVNDHGQRLLLGLLFSPLQRADILALVAAAYPDRGIPELLFSWLREILREQDNPPLGIALNENELIVLQELLEESDDTDFASRKTRSGLPKAELVMFRDALRSWPVLSRLFP